MAENVCQQQVFEKIFRESAPQLRNYLYYKCGNLERANDLVQDAFAKLWEKCKSVVPDAALPFLYTVAKNLMLNLIKKDNVRFEYASNYDGETLNSEHPEFEMEMNEYKTKLESAIAALPEGQREVFLMNRIDKLTYKQIAERLEVSQKAVEKRMSKALLKLKDVLQGH
ncbi:MAG: sigma-70 family RNA polymerase sigma factor [Balneola sp.]|nr:MAG: sigma-70 family RNA polymerase sigma factor [Balneola sp.]